jgi:HAD superfamily hydrolase (TIGR01490 family)
MDLRTTAQLSADGAAAVAAPARGVPEEWESQPLAPKSDVVCPTVPGADGHGQHGAAFFDLDNTLIQGASLFHFARGLAAHRFLTGRQIARFGWSQLTFRVRGERAGQVKTTRERALSFAAGRSVSEITGLCHEVFEDYLERKIWPGTRALAQAHLNRGEPVWLLTAAPDELASIVAERLGFTGALGTIAESVGGVYSGRLCGDVLHGPAKGDAMRALALREGYRLSACHAYSDSANDLPMLTAVGHPHAVNPDHKLRHYAMERGWPVVEYRTGVRLMRFGVPGSAAIGATAGAVAAGAALRRAGRRREAADSILG